VNLADCTRVYNPRARVACAHLLPSCSAITWSVAMCGVFPPQAGWYGTGTQDEWDHAAVLPLCTVCGWYTGVMFPELLEGGITVSIVLG